MCAWPISWLDAIKKTLVSCYDRTSHEGFGNQLEARAESVEYVSALAMNQLTTTNTTRKLADSATRKAATRSTS